MRNTLLKTILALFALFFSSYSWANYEEISKTLKVGEEFTCSISDYLDYSKWNGPRNWRASSWLTVVSEGSTYCKIRADRYVSGTLQVVCDWQEINSATNYEVTRRVTWNITVTKVDVSSVSLWSPIYLNADESYDITPGSQWMTIYPNNATIEGIQWTSKNTEVATITNSGHLVGKKPGTTTIYCMVNGSVRSNDAQVIVSEPSFTFKGFSIEDQTNNVETKPTITADYSLALTRSTNFDQIALTDEQGKKVDGTASINGSTISFTPTKHLQPLSTYTLTIPRSAVKNKWGTDYLFDQKVSFATADWKRMALSVQPEATYIMRGDQIRLSCDVPEATIYYSTNGDEPTTRYTDPLTFEQDMTLKAEARLDGYYDTEVLKKDYMQCIEIVEKYPDADPLYVYADVNPSITFSQQFSGDLSGITLQKEDTQMGIMTSLDFKPILHDHALYFVPNEPLELGMSYVVTVPDGALTTEKGEQMAAVDWRFTTGSYATAVSVGGPELMTALKTGGSLWTWGRRITEANAEDGSYSYTLQDVPAEIVNRDVVTVSSGYMHHALVKNDGTLWMWGRQLCGEFGNGSTAASPVPINIMGEVSRVSCGLQTTAIVKRDGSLWMCGRNDLAQIDSTRESRLEFVKLMDGVSDVRLSWGSLTVQKTDGTTITRTWNESADDQREPQNMDLDGMTDVQYGWQNAVALSPSGSVWTWDNSTEPVEVITGRSLQPAEGIAILGETLVMEKGERAVVPVRPMPLLADYSTLHYISSDAIVAEVSDRGVVTAQTDGKALVTVTMTDAQGQQYEAQLKVLVGSAASIGDAMADGGWRLQVVAKNHVLHVSGVPADELISIYNVSGTCVHQQRMTRTQLDVPVVHDGIYIVRGGRQVKKVMVH